MSVHVDDDGVRRLLHDGRVEEVRWDGIGEIRVVTTADGPAVDDLFFVLIGRDGESGCVVPHSAADEAFLRRLQAFPGFDNAQLVAATTSTGEREFRLWRGDW